MSLDKAAVLALLEPSKPEYERVKQIGPLSFMEAESRCGSRGCGSPTHYQICGVWYCMVHAAQLLNKMVVILANDKGWHKSYLKAKDQVTEERNGRLF